MTILDTVHERVTKGIIMQRTVQPSAHPQKDGEAPSQRGYQRGIPPFAQEELSLTSITHTQPEILQSEPSVNVPNPKQDWGYYATTPRLVRTGYKQLTPTQKWLYVCLKDLCGDHGTCFRTLESLSEETDLSTGMLSESIQVLHQAGLIHAEKKKRHEKGWPVWHISIVDIWGANAKEHPTKHSPCETNGSQNEENSENVHNVNETVHNVNENARNGSHGEANRQNGSQNRDRRNNTPGRNNTPEGITSEGVTPSKSVEPPQSTPPPEKPTSNKSSFSLLRDQWITTYGPYGDAKWDNDALRWIAEQGGSFDDIKLLCGVVADKRPEKVKNSWYKLTALKNPGKSPPGQKPPLGGNQETNLRVLYQRQQERRGVQA